MDAHSLLHEHFVETCPDIHATRLQAVMDVALSLQKSQSLVLSHMGRYINSSSDIKHKVKKVDRLESNKHLHEELAQIYGGLSDYIFTYVAHNISVPIVIDLCFVKDNGDIQMLSAEYASRGRTQPLYREVFKAGELKNRAASFMKNLVKLIPQGRTVVCIMDAGFCEDWFNAIESYGWNWIARVRGKKNIKFSEDDTWTNLHDFMANVGQRTKNYDDVLLYEEHAHPCRIITTRNVKTKKRGKATRTIKNRLRGGGCYVTSAKDPWILATNLPTDFNAAKVVSLYRKRMQIEESFRDIKSPQFGLAGRNIRTTCVHRWGVKMLLAAIVQMIFWIVGVVAHSQGLQKFFQTNTVKNKKVFSNFTLGKLVIEFDKLKELHINPQKIHQALEAELHAA